MEIILIIALVATFLVALFNISKNTIDYEKHTNFYDYKIESDISETSSEQNIPDEADDVERKNRLFGSLYSEIETDPHNAIAMMKELLIENPDNDEIRLLLANTLYSIKNFHDASANLDILVRKNPNRVDVNLLAAKTYKELGLKDKAITTFKSILKQDSSNIEALVNLGNLYSKDQSHRSAVEVYRRLVDLITDKEKLVTILSILGKEYLAIQEYDSAITTFHKVLEIETNNINAITQLKDIYTKKGKDEQAIEMLRKLISFESTDVADIEDLLGLLYKHKKFEDVMALTQRILTQDNIDISNVQSIIAKVYLQSGRYEDSIDILSKILKKYPDNLYLQQALAQAYKFVNRYEESINIFQNLISKEDKSSRQILKSNLSSVYCAYGNYLYLNFDYSAAFKMCKKALEYDSENHEAYYQIGCCDYKLKKYSDVMINYQRALELCPKNVVYLAALGNMYLECENIKNALELFNEVIEIEPENLEILRSMCKAYEMCSDHNKLIDTYEKILTLLPDNIDALVGLAHAHEQRNDAVAFDIYRNILELDPNNQTALNKLKTHKDNK